MAEEIEKNEIQRETHSLTDKALGIVHHMADGASIPRVIANAKEYYHTSYGHRRTIAVLCASSFGIIYRFASGSPFAVTHVLPYVSCIAAFGAATAVSKLTEKHKDAVSADKTRALRQAGLILTLAAAFGTAISINDYIDHQRFQQIRQNIDKISATPHQTQTRMASVAETKTTLANSFTPASVSAFDGRTVLVGASNASMHLAKTGSPVLA